MRKQLTNIKSEDLRGKTIRGIIGVWKQGNLPNNSLAILFTDDTFVLLTILFDPMWHDELHIDMWNEEIDLEEWNFPVEWMVE